MAGFVIMGTIGLVVVIVSSVALKPRRR